MNRLPSLKEVNGRYKPREDTIQSYTQLAAAIEYLNSFESPEKLVAEARCWVDRNINDPALRSIVTMLEQHFPPDTPKARAAMRFACGRYHPYIFAIAYKCSHDLTEQQRAADWCNCKVTDLARALVAGACAAAIGARPDIDWLVEFSRAHIFCGSENVSSQ